MASESATAAAAAGDVSGSATSGYDAFISYSHAQDRPLASALESGLEHFAKPWYRRRAMRVFRDESSLSASPGLWPTIEAALDDTRFLILVASRESAQSRWVAQEVQHWLDLGRRDRLLIALAEGEITWTDGGFDWSRTTALPQLLGSTFDDVPLYVDLRWARHADGVSLRDPRFREPLATLAAPLHDCPRDELIGEDLRQFRRTRRIARAAIATLSLLLIVTVIAALVALDQRSEARSQRDAAVRQAQLALGRQLTTETRLAPDDQLDLGLLLAAQAYALDPSPEQGAASVQVTLRSPHLVGYLPGTRTGTTAAIASTGTLLAIGDRAGRVTLWDALKRTRSHAPALKLAASITAVSFSSDGRRIIAGDERGRVVVWDAQDRREVQLLDVRAPVRSVALDASGARFAVTSADETQVGEIGGAVRTAKAFGDKRLAFIGDALVGMTGRGDLTTWDLRSPAPAPSQSVAYGFPLVTAVSADFALFAGATKGNTTYVVATHGAGDINNLPFDASALSIDAMAFDDGGQTLAIATHGTVQLWDLRTNSRVDSAMVGIPGGAHQLMFGDQDHVIVALADRGIAVWDLAARPTILHETRPSGTTILHEVPNALRTSSAAFSADGRLLAFTALEEDTSQPAVIVWDVERDEEMTRFDAQEVIGFSPDGRQVATQPFNAQGPIVVADVRTGTTREVSKLPWRATAARSTGKQRPVSASIPSDGVLRLSDTARNQRILDLAVTGAPGASALAFSPDEKLLAIATAGGTFTIVDADPASWRSHACDLAARRLTRAELTARVGNLVVPEACP